MAACGLRLERFPCAPGRSGPELIASLLRLEAFVSLRPEFQGGYTLHPLQRLWLLSYRSR